MVSTKVIIRVFIYFFVFLCIITSCFFYYFGDINKLKKEVETNLKNQLNCTVKLGELNWDWEGLKLGVTTSDISLYDNENNLILQGGPTRFVWHIKNIITGTYSHFYSIDSTDLYLNLIRYKNGVWNLIAIFPPGPPPTVDNLSLHNSIVYLIDELNPTTKTVLYKHFNIIWNKKLLSNQRSIDFVTRVGSLKIPSFLKVKGTFTEDKKFDWRKSEMNLSVLARQVNLSNWNGFLVQMLKEPGLKRIDGEFSGVIRLKKSKNDKKVTVKSLTKTNNFQIEFQNNEISQLIEIPKTDLTFKVVIDQKKIDLKLFRSTIDELTYELSGFIFNWSKSLPEVDVTLKTNKFNFKNVKLYLPLSLLPGDARSRIEPINDDGLVQIDLKLKGPAIAPKYYGTILLDEFNLTAESGFLNVIQGLNGKLVLNNEILKIETLNIPIEGSPLILTGEIDNEKLKTTFNLTGKDLNINILQNLLLQAGLNSSLLGGIESSGKLDLNLDVETVKDSPPEIKGKLSFHEAGLRALEGEKLEIKNVAGDLSLDGSKVTFGKLSGLINNEVFLINGDFSLKEDEAVNLAIYAKHLKIINYLLAFVSSRTPVKVVTETISGEASDLDLKIAGTFSKPVLNGMVLINNVSFELPKLVDKFSNISGSLRFEGTELIIEALDGMVQNANFGLAGYITDIFDKPKPKIRLVTEDIEVSNFWNYIKGHLKTTSLNVQADALEKLKGVAALDIFLDNSVLLGNVYFKDAEIKYKTLPFGLNSLSGRLVVGKENLSLFGLMGLIDASNNFNCELTVNNYLDPSFNIQGQFILDLDLPSTLKSANATGLNTITVDGLIPTIINFDILNDNANLSFYSTLSGALNLQIAPYFRKQPNKSYVLSGNLDVNTKDLNLYLNNLNIKSENLSLSTYGSIKNISSMSPDVMLNFSTDEPCGLYMVAYLIEPLMGYKIWGMTEFTGSISGTPSMYTISSNGKVTSLQLPEILGKKLKASDGTFSVYFNGEQGLLNSMVNNLNYVSLNAMSVSLSLNYLNPVFNLKELSIDGNPGSIFALGSYNPKDGAINFSANGSNIDLSSLGSFIFIDPDKLSGMTNFSFMIDGKGKTKDELIRDSEGNLSFSVIEGKLGQVALLQKGIQLANLFGQGIFGFNLRNVLSLFFKYQDGSFNNIHGEFNLEKGIIKAKELHYHAKNLLLNSFGFVDLINSFIELKFYGYLPSSKEHMVENVIVSGAKQSHNQNNSSEIASSLSLLAMTESTQPSISGAISIIPDALGKKRFVIPFLSSTHPEYFKFEVKGDIKNQKKITGHARRSFRWLKGKKLKKEYKYVPKPGYSDKLLN